MKPLIVIITGLSGSGKTVALRSLEDAGFFCVDNLPPQLIDPFATIMERANRTRFAIGIDVREKDLIPVVDETLASLRKKYTIEIIFLESDRESLIRRYKETRRPHPLAAPGGPGIEEAIAQEAELLGALRAEASRIIDTSSFTPHQLRHLMASIYGGREDVMNVTLLSFGYKYGIPLNADLLFDIRFIPNPHFVTALRELTGLDPEVMKFVLESPGTEDFLKRLMDFLAYLIPLYQKEGKAYLTIGIGCTGGRHRSPAVVDKIAPLVRKSVPVDVVHRDL